ncbi:MAG: DJ-1/PfpI family protein [Oscillospiraceae bacterium]|nr:DJ-1/PfpI family protein [Oscillospiraceae bacterium]
MKKALILLAPGFEEIEAVAPCDILRRGGVQVTLCSCGESLTVDGSHGVPVTAERFLRDTDTRQYDAVIAPGGLRGVKNLLACQPALDAMAEAYGEGRLVAAICAGPLVLTKAGVLEGKNAVCYPGMEGQMSGRMLEGHAFALDGNVMTSRSAGTALDFGLALLEYLTDGKTAEKVRSDIHYNEF